MKLSLPKVSIMYMGYTWFPELKIFYLDKMIYEKWEKRQKNLEVYENV